MKKTFSLLYLCTLSCFFATAQPLAFPEADGYGRFTVGGRGGEVYVVTSLEDRSDDPLPGTLRHAIEQKGARTVVFAVSGVIQLKDDLRIKKDSITIAGQTSPGGICLRGATTRVDANQVIIRYLRFRLGAVEPDDDAATGARHRDIIIDHCSFSWSIDETASFYINQNFTLQYSIISESLADAGHIKGPHGYGGIWGGSGASFHHNLLAHHTSRNPRVQGYRYQYKPPYPEAEELTDIRNNVLYNWKFHSMYGAENGQFNLINNYYKPGPASKAERFFQFSGGDTDLNYGKAYVAGNYFEGQPGWLEDNVKGLDIKPWDKEAEAPNVRTCLMEKPFAPSILPLYSNETDYLHTETAEQAYQHLVLQQEVGANRNAHGFFLDEVDRRILQEVKEGTVLHDNGIINHEKEVLPSWEKYAESFQQFPAPADEDLNGLPDAWEKAKGVRVPNAHDLSETYTNIEVYCNELGAAKKKVREVVYFVPNDTAQQIDVFVGGAFFTSYIYRQGTLKKPVLFPLMAASGIEVTRGYPLATRPGERIDHPHHYGLWFNHGDVNGVDFWNNSDAITEEKKQHYGTILHTKVSEIQAGEAGRLNVEKDWVMPDGQVILKEKTAYTFSGGEHYRQIDHHTALSATKQTVLFKDSKEGMFALRVARQLELPSDEPVLLTDESLQPTAEKIVSQEGVTGQYLNSEGVKGYEVWGRRARWVKLSGEMQGDSIAIVIMDAPGNHNHPPHWMARGYGLFGVNPFGSKIYTEGKEELNFELQPGESVEFRHRVVIFDGRDPSLEEVEGAYREFVEGAK